MNDLVRSTWLVFAVTLPRLLRSRRTWFVAFLAFAPATFASIAARLSSKPAPEMMAVAVGWLFLAQVIVPLASLILASAAVAEEVEDRTLTYLFTRPMPRPALLLGRWAAMTFVLAALFTASTYAFVAAASTARGEGPPIGDGISGPLLAGVLGGVCAYGALAASLGAFVKHPIVVGLAYAFAVEGFLANLPGRNQLLTVQYHVRSLIAEHGSPAWSKVEGFAATGFEDGTTAIVVLCGITLCALALGSWRIARREFLVTS